MNEESKSSVKITLNYKGEPQIEVKIYDGTTQVEADKIKEVAVNTFNATLSSLGLQLVTSNAY